MFHELLKTFSFVLLALPTTFDLDMLARHLGAQKVHESVIPVFSQPYAAKQVSHVVIRNSEAFTARTGQLLEDGLHKSKQSRGFHRWAFQLSLQNVWIQTLRAFKDGEETFQGADRW